jgi:hypothetical protein
MTWLPRSLILIISICIIVISINVVLDGNVFDAKKIVNDSQLDSFGLAIFFVGSTRFALSLATICLSKTPEHAGSMAESQDFTRYS